MQSGAPAPKSLLLVDDTQCYCALMERAFRQAQTGTAIFTLSDGQRAIEHLVACGTRHPIPDLVLLDRDMPGGPDGYAVLRAARAMQQLAALPILMVSGSDEPEHIEAATAAGADGYIIKPPMEGDCPELVRQVLAWWREKNWSQLGPKLAGSDLALPSSAVGSPLAMTPTTDFSELFAPAQDDRTGLQRLVGFVDWVKETATAMLDPFQLSLSKACRRHHITAVQLMQGGGSHRMLANRRAVLVDLLNEGWPDETLLEVVYVSRTELKRLHAAARAKVGPKLVQGHN